MKPAPHGSPAVRSSGFVELLDHMLEDMADAPDLYRPTAFWETGLSAIIDDLRTIGIESFRSHPSALAMYVPLYANQGRLARLLRALTRPRPEIAHRLVDNIAVARADYRVAVAGDVDGWPDLASQSESSVGEPVEQFLFEGRRFSKSFLNYIRGLVLLKRSIEFATPRVVLEIGGGFGTLGEIVCSQESPTLYIDVDIPPVAAVATWYLQQVLGPDAVATYDDLTRGQCSLDIDELAAQYRAVVLCPWQLEKLVGTVDGFVNSISFQEMEPAVVENYADQVTRLAPEWLLLRNSATGKPPEKPGGIGVDVPVRSEDYMHFFGGYECVASDSVLFGEARGEFRSVVHVYRASESQRTMPERAT